MKIAILAWGSVVWKPGSLKDHLENNAKFEQGGPELPIEFSRVSDDGRLTLVIDEEHGRKVTTFVATSSRSELLEARDDLMHREKTKEQYIGLQTVAVSKPPSVSIRITSSPTISSCRGFRRVTSRQSSGLLCLQSLTIFRSKKPSATSKICRKRHVS